MADKDETTAAVSKKAAPVVTSRPRATPEVQRQGGTYVNGERVGGTEPDPKGGADRGKEA